MSISFACESCGKNYRLRDELAGKKAKCACGAVLTVPEISQEPEDGLFDLKEDQVAPPAPAMQVAAEQTPHVPAYKPATHVPEVIVVKRRAAGMRFVCYILLLLAMIPLAVSVLHPTRFDIEDELAKTVENHPESIKPLKQVLDDTRHTDEDIFKALPNHKLDSAWLSHDTWQHWIYAVISSVLFTGMILAIFPRAVQNVGKMILVCIFTATVGIFLLLAFQYIAMWTQGTWIRGGGRIAILFYIIKFIGFSYSAAMDPESGVFLSAMGFTFGVGLCEEITKSLPVLVHYQTKASWPWQTAVVVGLISGVGFGVSEGITYSSDYYNGLMGGEIYLIRFISCVALHAVWSGSAAVFAFRQQSNLQSIDGFFDGLLWWVAIISVPMVLHGFYDTLLKKDHEGWALAVAVASFAYLIFLIELTLKDYGHEEDQEEVTPAYA